MPDEMTGNTEATAKFESSKSHAAQAAEDLRAAAEAKATELRAVEEAKAQEYRSRAEQAYSDARTRARTPERLFAIIFVKKAKNDRRVMDEAPPRFYNSCVWWSAGGAGKRIR